MSQECLFRVGQRVWSILHEWGTVDNVGYDDLTVGYRVSVKFNHGRDYWKYYTIEGKEPGIWQRELFFEKIPIPESALRPKRWMAKQGCGYYYLDSLMQTCKAVDDGSKSHGARYSSGNYFQTETDAERAVEKVRNLLISLHE